jgi:hypothetical protein
LGVDAGRGAFGRWGGSTGRFEAHRGTSVPCAPDSPSLLTTEGKPPRGSRGPVKVIVVQGELREMIQDVSGRP